MNYSRIIVEAIMAMKRPPVKIPPSGRVPEQGCRSPRLDFWGDGASLYVSWKITPSPIKLGFWEIYKRRGDERRWPGRPGAHQARARVWPYLGVSWLPPWPPSGSPSVSVFVPGKNWSPWIFSPFREYFFKNFSEIQKQQKTATGLGHLVNRLVHENIRKTKENMWKHVENIKALDRKQAWSIKNYRYVCNVSASPSLTPARPRVGKW